MKLMTWNVNSVRSRLQRLVAVLDRHEPDVVCLQELKGIEEVFPREAIEAAGYYAAVYGQKAYNGVAILSRTEPERIVRGMGDEDPQARLIAADIRDVRVLSAYVPNGSEVGSEKYQYKLAWLKRLTAHLAAEYSPDDKVVLCGDFNVAVDDADVRNPAKWADSVLCHPTVRDALESVRAWGFVDVFRKHHPAGGVYSWWDYRRLGFQTDDGIRLDHVYATASLAAESTAADVDRDERKGKGASDHAPVVVTFEDRH